MISKFEAVGIGLSVLFMAVALYLVRLETSFLNTATVEAQPSSVASSIVVGQSANVNQARTAALMDATDARGRLNSLVIEDIVTGTGPEVKKGDRLVVHYIGRLQDGLEFDNSMKRGEPLTFTVGQGRVIKGWEEGVLGMKAGGQRVLVIPADMAYGNQAVGPIPPRSTLVFAIELLSIN
jgi:FKBP-type peptidyl-prolyl cis-trans isomerase